MSHRTDLNALDWLTVSQAAEYAGVSPSTILRWEKRGHIQAHRTPTNHRRFAREEVAALLTKGGVMTGVDRPVTPRTTRVSPAGIVAGCRKQTADGRTSGPQS